MHTFAPSELAYFHAGRFAREKKMVDAVALVHGDAKYDASELAEAILAIAFLAAHEAGEIVLEKGRVPRLFGLRKVDALLVKPGHTRGVFPLHAFESKLVGIVTQPRKNGWDVEAVVQVLLEEDTSWPHTHVLHLLVRGLAERGLLERRESRTLKVFRSMAIVVPDATRALIDRSSPDVPARLHAARESRPDEWRLLLAGIRAGVRARTENDSGDGPD